MTLAETLARRVHPDPSPEFLAGIAADAELMEIAAVDLDTAARMLIDHAVDVVAGYVAVARDTTQKAA